MTSNSLLRTVFVVSITGINSTSPKSSYRPQTLGKKGQDVDAKFNKIPAFTYHGSIAP